jgi:hypothetical protein
VANEIPGLHITFSHLLCGGTGGSLLLVVMYSRRLWKLHEQSPVCNDIPGNETESLPGYLPAADC